MFLRTYGWRWREYLDTRETQDEDGKFTSVTVENHTNGGHTVPLFYLKTHVTTSLRPFRVTGGSLFQSAVRRGPLTLAQRIGFLITIFKEGSKIFFLLLPAKRHV